MKKGGHKTIRFTSEKNAKSFANQTKGKLIDCRQNDDRKSNFKVKYSRDNAREHERDKHGI